jgi:hypothetical protein
MKPLQHGLQKPSASASAHAFAACRKPEPDRLQKRVTMDDFWVAQGWCKPDDGTGKTRFMSGKWRKGETVRQDAVRFLVEKVLMKDPRDIIQEDFYSNKLGGLLGNHYRNSPYLAVKDAGYAVQASEMVPQALYGKKSNRVKAIKQLVKECGKKPRDITRDDFNSNHLGTLLNHDYNGSPYRALTEAGYKLQPWEMLHTPKGFYGNKSIRVKAIKQLVRKCGKEPCDVVAGDFYSNRLRGLLDGYYAGSPYAALKEAGYRIHPWEMIKTPDGFYRFKGIRVKAIKQLVSKCGKKPRDITEADFSSNRLGGLLSNHYGGSPFLALLEAGFITKKDEAYMRSNRHAKSG